MSLFNRQNQPTHQIVRSVSYPYHGHAVPVAQRPPTRYSKALSFLVMAGVLVVSGLMLGLPGKQENEVKATSTTQGQIEESKPEPPRKLDFTAMSSTINTTIQQYPSMDIGVAVIDIKTGDAESYGVENPFVAASVAKLLTAISYLHDVEDGKATLTQQVGSRTAQAALEALIVESDNVAWNDFNNGVMSHAELAEYATSIGMTNYNPDNNTITPASVALLLSNLYQEKLINHEHTELLLSYMARAKEVEFILNTVPTGTKVYHKPGYLADRMHDAAIIDNGARPYVLVVFTKSRVANTYNTIAGEAIFTQITQATLTAFNQ